MSDSIEQYFDDLERDLRDNSEIDGIRFQSKERMNNGKLEVRIYEVYLESDGSIKSVRNDLDRLQVDEIRKIDEENQKITVKDSFDKDLH
jgi:hypothetical protein